MRVCYDKNNPTFNPDMLELAIGLRGITWRELAKSTGISGADLFQFRKGYRQMNRDDLVKIAEELNFPISFFAIEDRIQAGIQFACKLED